METVRIPIRILTVRCGSEPADAGKTQTDTCLYAEENHGNGKTLKRQQGYVNLCGA